MSKLIFLLVTISFFSCTKNTITKELQELKKYSISIPSDIMVINNGQLISSFIHDTLYAKLIIYYDSTECSSCHIAHLNDWNEIIQISHQYNKFRPIFIFSPSKSKISDVLNAIEKFPFNYPMLLDFENKFYKKNTFIPNNLNYHTFLLNKNNQIILVGNPLYNSQLWNLYQKTIHILIDNNGVIPKHALLYNK